MSNISVIGEEGRKKKKRKLAKKRLTKSPTRGTDHASQRSSRSSSPVLSCADENARRLGMVAPGAVLVLPHKAFEPDSLGRENPVWAFYPATVLSTKPAIDKNKDQLRVRFRWRDGSGDGQAVIDANNMRSGKRMHRSMRRKTGKTPQDKKAMRTWGFVRQPRARRSR